jgi:hypothetical protein
MGWELNKKKLMCNKNFACTMTYVMEMLMNKEF